MTSGVKLVRNGAEHARRLEALIENEDIEVKKAPEVLWSSRTEVWSQLHEKGLMNECEAKLRLKLSALSVELALRESTSVTDSVRLLDEALILGHPSFKYLCSSMVDELAPIDGALRVRHEPMALLGHERIREIAVNMMEAQNLMETIPSVERPSIAQFLSRIFWKGPRLISGVVSKWPAFRKWNDFKFWEAEHGHRWVPVELGSKYTDPSFETQMIPISDFVDQHLRGESGGYLAQHQLFEQVPSLLRDIIEPEFASLGESSSEAVVNMWLGPSGTQTPLHHDPYHNLLCQVGRQQVPSAL
uniref:JmjC domain-containing protein n=1 Tax=Rhodosorus marinus TaxID=101924 RepID=A0A7S2ZH96_9RHOD|mmetsp:Transcript_19577/g.77992  ORF Transcript_19577/g.77992 Transcript_19577/m.77992 type:complete len:302 (+) Transcript_19577:278-1183(+)